MHFDLTVSATELQPQESANVRTIPIFDALCQELLVAPQGTEGQRLKKSTSRDLVGIHRIKWNFLNDTSLGAVRIAGLRSISILKQDDFVNILDGCFDRVLIHLDCSG